MDMTRPIATCQCTRNQAAPCGAPITQEDLLCDICRLARQPGYTHGTAAQKGASHTQHFAVELYWESGQITVRALGGEAARE
jgi:hypothetical protein